LPQRIAYFRVPYLRLWLIALVACGVLVFTHISAAVDMRKLEASFLKMGGSASDFARWNALMTSSSDTPVERRLRKVNEFFNREIIFTDDQALWGQSDYWATPMESLSRGKGDCEDYVIAKYFALRNMGVPDAQLRLVYVRALVGGANSSVQQAHMVLAYYPDLDSEPMILDNLITDIRAASRRPDLSPVFSFNAQGVFASAARNAPMGAGGASRLTRWQNLLERAWKEGFE
jgi:predicted transglutaminase-like cysteine proteinase